MNDKVERGESEHSHRLQRFGVVALLVFSITALAIAPTLMPESYSPLSLSISESAAQGVKGAWLARTAFLFYGFAVLWLARLNSTRWGRLGTALFGVFGVAMTAVAAYSHRPWIAGAPTDMFEDLLHTVAATGMGMAFAFGVIAVAFRRKSPRIALRLYDFTAVGVSFVFPMIMMNGAAIAGLLQRIMFLIAYLWYAAEALRNSPAEATDDRAAGLEGEPVQTLEVIGA